MQKCKGVQRAEPSNSGPLENRRTRLNKHVLGGYLRPGEMLDERLTMGPMLTSTPGPCKRAEHKTTDGQGVRLRNTFWSSFRPD